MTRPRLFIALGLLLVCGAVAFFVFGSSDDESDAEPAYEVQSRPYSDAWPTRGELAEEDGPAEAAVDAWAAKAESPAFSDDEAPQGEIAILYAGKVDGETVVPSEDIEGDTPYVVAYARDDATLATMTQITKDRWDLQVAKAKLDERQPVATPGGILLPDGYDAAVDIAASTADPASGTPEVAEADLKVTTTRAETVDGMLWRDSQASVLLWVTADGTRGVRDGARVLFGSGWGATATAVRVEAPKGVNADSLWPAFTGPYGAEHALAVTAVLAGEGDRDSSAQRMPFNVPTSVEVEPFGTATATAGTGERVAVTGMAVSDHFANRVIAGMRDAKGLQVAQLGADGGGSAAVGGPAGEAVLLPLGFMALRDDSGRAATLVYAASPRLDRVEMRANGRTIRLGEPAGLVLPRANGQEQAPPYVMLGEADGVTYPAFPSETSAVLGEKRFVEK